MYSKKNESETNIKKILDDKINIQDVMTALHVTDVRSAIRWCKRKSILVIKFGKDRFVNLIDFELAVDRPFIESLKMKHPENWKVMYSAYKKGDYELIAEQMLQKEPIVKTKFVAPGAAGNNFLKMINKKDK